MPPEIGQLTNLRELDLIGNRMSELPPVIVLLTNLSLISLL
jgi:Leucine-rich repeat (LRR) protein